MIYGQPVLIIDCILPEDSGEHVPLTVIVCCTDMYRLISD